jgi:sarcosine oxidase/L-pipecolate oxidase
LILLTIAVVFISLAGNFIVTYHPDYSNLFLATGGSGHGYKFFPVLGEKIVDALERRLDPQLEQLWKWPIGRPTDISSPLATEDGSRSGQKGMILPHS